MSDVLEKLQLELQATERELAESKARIAHMETQHQATASKLEIIHKQIEHAHQEWMTSLDVVSDPIFLLDKDFQILRCNRAYQRYAGIPFKQIIGRPYYKIFPKTHAPLPNFSQDPAKAEVDSEIVVGDTTFRLRTYVVTDEQDSFQYSIHILENINEQLRSQRQLQESEEQYRRLFESTKDGILILDAETGKIIDANPFILDLLCYSFDELAGKVLWETGLLADVEANKKASEKLLSEEYIRHENMLLMSKDGRRVQVEFVSNNYAAGERKVIQCNIRDVTERVRAKELLIASHDLLKNVIENTPVRVFWKDTDLRFLGCNAAFAHDAGMSCPEDLIGKDDFQMGWRDQAELYRGDDQQVMDSGMPKLNYEERQTTPDGGTLWVRTSKVPLRAANGDIIGMLGIYEDITERRQSEENLKLFRSLLDNSSDAIEVIDPATFQFIDVNETAHRALGYSREELLSMQLTDIDPQASERQTQKIQEALHARGSITFETHHRRKDSSRFPVEVSLSAVTAEKPYLVAVVRDITERKRAEASLRDSEERLHAIFEGVLDGIALADLETMQFIDGNAAMFQMLGYNKEEFIQLGVADIHPQQDFPRVLEQFDRQAAGEIHLASDLPIKRKDGSVFYADVNTAPVQFGGKRYIVGVFRDTTERKQADETLKRTNRTLKTLSASNLALVRATSEDELLRQVTKTIVLNSDYRLATVCYAADDPQKSITPMAWSGTEDSYYLSDEISWANTEQGQLPIAEAIRNGKIENCADIASYAGYAPWKSAALAHSYASNIALPLNSGDKTFGGLSIYSSKINAFDTEEVQLLEELADDLAYGIEALRTRKEHEQHAIILRQSLKQFIQTIADTVEARDLYTAGHQRRVAELATAIAQEMGLPEEQIDGINLAAIIHDLGKIRIPSEILSKPGKINEVEFMLIKTHPQAGYDILKNVKFPWPIADIILQHHEKMDGSGYPQGLKGDQILLESRILTVADVVEAMSSHRPYRAALGIEAALDEIRRGRKVEYDAAAVDACLKLFTEKEFKFSDL
jgi:PAS domain S-box-containing protein/putative nucleotidyltransferase with HDIG domain